MKEMDAGTRRILLEEQERAAYIAGDTTKAAMIANIMRLEDELEQALDRLKALLP